MMYKKHILVTLLVIVGIYSLSCSGNQKEENKQNRTSNTEGYPKIKFDTTYYDFGTMVQGEQAAFTFKFTNTGAADLVILDAFSTCGCTVPEYSDEPIPAGGEGKVEVIFNSEGKRGLQYKTVTLKLNTEMKQKTLTLKANVLE